MRVANGLWMQRCLPRAAIGALVCLLAACAALLGPRTVDVPRARLQALLDRQFPVETRLLELFDATLSAPRLLLRPETNRIATEFDVTVADRLFKVPHRGTLALDYGLRFEASDNTVRLTTVRVERFEIDGVPAPLQRQLGRIGVQLAEQQLSERVLYTLRPEDVATVQGRGYRPADIRVTPAGLTITLLPNEPR